LAISFYTQAATSSLHDALRLGDIMAGHQKWSEAAQWYLAAWQQNESKPLPLYLYARALQHSGEQDKGEQFAERALLMPMGNSEVRHELASGLKERGFRDEARLQYELILRTGDFQDGRLIDAAKQVGNLVHATNELRAADCWETMLLSCLKPHWVFVEKGGYIQIPHLVHKTRARGLLKAGQVDLAIKEAWASFRAAPANSELAEELVPLLKAANRSQDANELFTHSANRLRELSETFPECATFHNNMAWLFVRCDADLNEALDHARRALELEPNRTSFVDTVGEVHFRLGQYEEAMACAERCVKAEPRSAHYQAQVERFRVAQKVVKD
jgi:tetratricopeptide (TPR) repeat protein